MSSIAIYDLVLVAFWWRVMRVYIYIHMLHSDKIG